MGGAEVFGFHNLVLESVSGVCCGRQEVVFVYQSLNFCVVLPGG